MVRSHYVYVLQALFVTFLWSTSWVLIKVGLEDIPALTFAGLRYVLAAVVLLPFLLRGGRGAALARMPARSWRDLLVLGLVLYTLTQGAQFLALAYLPAATLSLMLSFSPVLVAGIAAFALHERLVVRQWLGIGVYLSGALIYFGPATLAPSERIGMVVALVGLTANAVAAVLGRAVNRTASIDPLLVTLVSMGAGALALLGTGLAVEGPPALSPTSWLIVLWLALVNTAFAFTLWNATLRHLSAVESSVVNNTMLVQIAILAWVFLGEVLHGLQVAGIVLAALGTLVVQIRPGLRRARGPTAHRGGGAPRSR